MTHKYHSSCSGTHSVTLSLSLPLNILHSYSRADTYTHMHSCVALDWRPSHSLLAPPVVLMQVGFFDIVALPLFQSFAQAFPDSTPLLDAVKDNYSMWREEFSQPTSKLLSNRS